MEITWSFDSHDAIQNVADKQFYGGSASEALVQA